MVKKRSLAGNAAVGVFVIALVTTFVAFCSPSWLVSDYRITGAKLEKMGLWTHCFRSLPDPRDEYQKRFFVGCRWVYDPFTTGYDQIRGYLLPSFMVATQFFFTLAFLGVMISLFLILLYFLCCGPDQGRYIQLIRIIAFLLLGSGLSGGLAVIIFACLGNTDNWMPEHANNYLGWSFGLGVVGCVATIVSSVLFFTEVTIQRKKRKLLKESQTRFTIEQESKA
ncbi:hypothetical protein RUM43_000913 [Polyplax serrata]|uniref:Uncharacterized protein n=1 Tax=Polyplax serrata TaxID=468196 RepID=A0AAN8SHX6_POLSC